MLKNVNSFGQFEQSVNENKITAMARKFHDKISGKGNTESTEDIEEIEEIEEIEKPVGKHRKTYAPEREKTEEKYVGVMPESDRKMRSWKHDGMFLEFNTAEDAKKFVDDTRNADMVYKGRKMSSMKQVDKEGVDNTRNIKYMGDTDKGKISRFAGLIPESNRKHSAWYHNGIFKEFETKEEAQKFIDDIKSNDMMYNGRKIKTTSLFNEEYMDKMDKVRKQGQ